MRGKTRRGRQERGSYTVEKKVTKASRRLQNPSSSLVIKCAFKESVRGELIFRTKTLNMTREKRKSSITVSLSERDDDHRRQKGEEVVTVSD